MKKVIAVILSLALLLGNAPLIQAEEVPSQVVTEDKPAGLMPLEMHYATDEEVARVGIYDEAQTCGEDTTGSIARYALQNGHVWDTYATDYYYNQLTAQEKIFWDALDSACYTYLASEQNTDEFIKFTPGVGLSEQRLTEVAYLFRISNPQYYFIDNRYAIGQPAGDPNLYWAWGVYSTFRDGKVRQLATQCMQTRINTWVSKINACNTDTEKVRKIHDLICEYTKYDNDVLANMSNLEPTHFTQSAFSTFCMNQTVCAGYSQAFCLLSNAVGIDAISVTSDYHQWNNVKINDKWYNVDLTWDDADMQTGSFVQYKYYLRDDIFWDTDPSDTQGYHDEESFYTGIKPECSEDTNYNTEYGYITVDTAKKVSEPVMTIGGDAQRYVASVTNLSPGTTVYYTIDNEQTDAATVPIHTYQGQFQVNPGDSITAVAVRDGYIDSNIMNGYVTITNPGTGTTPDAGTTPDTGTTQGTGTTPNTQPSVNQNLAAGKIKSLTNVKKGIQIKWNKVTGATGYQVWRKQGSGSYSKIATIKNNSTVSYTDTGVKNKSGKTYTYKVIPYNGSTKASGGTKSIIRLTTPVLSSAKNTAKSTVTLKWKKVTGAKGYYVYRKTGNGSFKKIATVKGGTKLTYKDKKAKKGKTYTYSIKSYNGKSISSYAKKSLKVKGKR